MPFLAQKKYWQKVNKNIIFFIMNLPFKAKSNHIYLMHVVKTNFYKIGISFSPQKRLIDVRISCPLDVVLFYNKKVSHASTIESLLHSTFQKKHIRGEWFRLNKSDIATIKKIISKNNHYYPSIIPHPVQKTINRHITSRFLMGGSAIGADSSMQITNYKKR